MAVVQIKSCGLGVNKDLSPEEITEGAWSDSKNVRFRNGYAEKYRGIAQVYSSTSVTTNGLFYYETPTARNFVHVSPTKVFSDDGTTRTDITPASDFTGSFDDKWSGGVFSGNLVLTNGVDKPVYWDGNVANNLTTLPGWDATWKCDVIRPWKQYLIALSVTKGSTKYPNMVKWSDAGGSGSLPASWDEADTTLDAGEQDLSETTDLIVDALPMGDVLLIYKQRSIFQVSLIGQPYIFRFQRLPGEDGLMARGCVVDTPVGHVFVSNGDIKVHDGTRAQSICEGIVRGSIFKNMSSDYWKRTFLVTNPQKHEVLVCYPEEGSTYCNKAAIWNWKYQTWAFRDLPNATGGATGQIPSTLGILTWDTDTATWEDDISIWNENEYSVNEARCLLSFTNKIGAFDIGSDDFGSVFSAYIERIGMNFNDSTSIKLLRRFYPKIDANNGTEISFQAGSAMVPDAVPTYQQPATFTSGTDFKVDTFASGRYLAIRISSNSRRPWRIKTLDMDIVPAGSF